MKKVVLKGTTEYKSFATGLFTILLSIDFLVYVYAYFGATLEEEITLTLYTLPFIAIGIFLTRFDKFVAGIKSITISESNIVIKIKDAATKKEYLIDLLRSDILSCKLKLQYQASYSKKVLKGHDSNILKFISVSFNVYCEKDKSYEINFFVHDNLKIKQLFSIAKYLPNFSYEIDTNSQEWQEQIESIALFGKATSFIQYYKTFFANPKVPYKTKKSTIARFVITVLLSILLFIVIIFLAQYGLFDCLFVPQSINRIQ